MTATKVGQTICSLNDLTFPVELRDNERKTNREYSKVVSGVVDNEVMDLNYCSPVYQLVPNSDIFPVVEKILKDKEIDFSVQYSHTQHARFYGNFIIEDPRFAYIMDKSSNDMIKFIWNFQHSYNGLTKYMGVAGFYRLVCSNGVVVPVKEMKEHNLIVQGKHTASILNSLKEFSGIIENITNNLGVVKTSIVQKYELLGGRNVPNVQNRIKEVLAATKITAVDNSKFNTVNDITARILKEAKDTGLGYNGRVDDWLVWNGINQYIYDDTRNIAAPEKRRDTDSKVLEYMLEHYISNVQTI